MNHDKLLRWCKSEDEAKRLMKEGWKVADQRVTRHSHYSVLLEKPAPPEMG